MTDEAHLHIERRRRLLVVVGVSQCASQCRRCRFARRKHVMRNLKQSWWRRWRLRHLLPRNTAMVGVLASCLNKLLPRHACSTRVCAVAVLPPARRKLCHAAVVFAHVADRSKRARTHGCTTISPIASYRELRARTLGRRGGAQCAPRRVPSVHAAPVAHMSSVSHVQVGKQRAMVRALSDIAHPCT